MASKPEDDTSVVNSSCFFQRPKSLPLPKSVTRIVNRESISKCSHEKGRSQSISECENKIELPMNPPKNDITMLQSGQDTSRSSSEDSVDTAVYSTCDYSDSSQDFISEREFNEKEAAYTTDQSERLRVDYRKHSATDNIDRSIEFKTLRDAIKARSLAETMNDNEIETDSEQKRTVNRSRSCPESVKSNESPLPSAVRFRRDEATLTLDPSKLTEDLRERQLNQNFVTIDPTINTIIDTNTEDSINGDIENSPSSGSVPFPTGKRTYKACEVCCDFDFIYERFCCQSAICDVCMETYIANKVSLGIVRIICPSSQCENKYVVKDEIAYRLPIHLKSKYHKFLVDQNKSPYEKTCPNCSLITKMDEHKVKHAPKKGLNVTCEDCDFRWCFICQGPSHDRLTCKQTLKGDTLMRKWAKQVGSALVDRPNAVKCPKCNVSICHFIHNSTGKYDFH